MESAHGELGARLAYGLCRNYSNSFSNIYGSAAGKVAAIALATYAMFSLASQNGANRDFSDSCFFYLLGDLLGNLLVGSHYDLASYGMADRV
ncbi:MAG: hypothetical protein BWX44_00494 [Spirochaetes bacterium ADurb.Bin001]|nr:MAG: hypothetical protein BWX44_00494 [Spirochaetes bacterium ADurb.Bin001]